MNARIFIMVIIVFITSQVEAGFLFHATDQQASKRIAARDFSAAKMKAKSRFGKGVYLASSRKTALAEKPVADAVIRFNRSKYLSKSSLDLYRPSTQRLKGLCPNTSLQGKVKRGIIGPQLGRKLGRMASRRDKAIIYRSVKQPNGGKAIFIPRHVYCRHPRIVRPVK
ncbi:MAG: hypothetical protein ABIJ30_13165 [bacterium]